jgi:hypothetical protein
LLAKIAGVSKGTVAAVRTELETTGQIGQLEKTTGADGKERPASMPQKRKWADVSVAPLRLASVSKPHDLNATRLLNEIDALDPGKMSDPAGFAESLQMRAARFTKQRKIVH